jgi:hypothetical protein
MPVHHWVAAPTSMSYLRAKASLPSAPVRNTVRPDGRSTTLPSSRRTGRQRTGDQHARARIKAKGSGMGGANIGVPYRGRLPGLLVDREHRDVAFTCAEHHFAVHVLHPGSGSACVLRGGGATNLPLPRGFAVPQTTSRYALNSQNPTSHRRLRSLLSLQRNAIHFGPA